MRTKMMTAGLAVLVWGCFGAGRAEAVPIPTGQGEWITFLADLPAESPLLRQPGRIGGVRPNKVGYSYRYFHVCWAPVWTYDGAFVAYESDRRGALRVPLGNDGKAAALQAGMKPETFQPPFLYRYPLGWWLIGAILLIFGLTRLIPKSNPTLGSDPNLPRALREDVQFMERMNVFKAMNLEGRNIEELTMSEIRNGIDTLVSLGFSRDEAEQKLARVLEALRTRQPAPT